MPRDADGFPIYHLSITRRFNGRERGAVKKEDVKNSEVKGEVRIKGRTWNTMLIDRRWNWSCVLGQSHTGPAYLSPHR